MKILVIGSQEAVLGFSLVGVAGKAVQTAAEVNQALDNALASKEPGIILVTQDVASLIQARMDYLKLRSTVPLVVEIPSSLGVGADQPALSEIVLKAIGIKI
jgi:V/A-type H+-transporting ATPase subunit F